MPAYKSKTSTDKPTKIAQAVEATPTDVKGFLALARERFKTAVDAETNWRKAALDDMKFLTGRQWPDETKRLRDTTNRPCLTINRLPAIKSQIVNEQRAQRPAIVVKPAGDGATVEAAEMLEGLVRHVQVISDAEIAIDTCFDSMVACGKGYIEIFRDYLPGETFNQELYIGRVKNVFTIYCDPSSVQPDESDANWKFKICDYSFEEYRAQFPGSQLATLSDYSSIGDNFPGWGDSKTIRVAEYWHKEFEPETLYLMEDGSAITKTIYNLRNAGIPAAERKKPVDERPYRKTRIVCSIINAIEVIDEYDFPGRKGFIPLIPCLGEDYMVDSERELYGIIRNSKDSQRAINYMRSYAAETIALAPKAPWIGWKGQFKDPKWLTANLVNYPFLEADVVTTAGQPAPSLPERNTFEPPIQAILAMSQAVDQDLKATTGIYEPSLGQNKSDQSGRAIDLLQKQGGLTNLNFTDNLSRTLRAVGRVLLDAAPYIYDAPRIQRIVKASGDVKQVILHAGRSRAADQLKSSEITEIYDLSLGNYDVVIDVGPDYKTKREEAFTQQMQLAEADKTGTILKVAGDIIVANSNMPGAREIADRIKRTIPSNITADDSTDPKVQLDQAKQMVTQLQQQNQQLMTHNQQMMETIREDTINAKKDIQIAEIRKSATVEAAAISAKTDLLRIQFEKLALAHEASHERAMAASNLATQPSTDGSAADTSATGEENASPNNQ